MAFSCAYDARDRTAVDNFCHFPRFVDNLRQSDGPNLRNFAGNAVFVVADGLLLFGAMRQPDDDGRAGCDEVSGGVCFKHMQPVSLCDWERNEMKREWLLRHVLYVTLMCADGNEDAEAVNLHWRRLVTFMGVSNAV